MHENTMQQLTLGLVIDLPLNHPLPFRAHDTAYPGVDYAERKRSRYIFKSEIYSEV
jgi:hypothetical protein